MTEICAGFPKKGVGRDLRRQPDHVGKCEKNTREKPFERGFLQDAHVLDQKLSNRRPNR